MVTKGIACLKKKQADIPFLEYHCNQCHGTGITTIEGEAVYCPACNGTGIIRGLKG